MILSVYRALAPFAALTLPLVALFNRKVRAGLRLRRAPVRFPTFTEPPIWIHVSSGEFEYAKPVIRALKERRPKRPIVVTFFSPSYARQVTEFAGVDHAEPLPLDLPGPVTAFLDRVRPAALLVARTDFWPEVLTQAGRREIPRVVFAYTQAEVRGLKARVTRWQLGLVDEVFAVTEADRARVRELAPTVRTAVAGDPRYDQVDHRLRHPRPLDPSLTPTLPALVAGSTWDEDEAVVIPALAELARARRLQLILVPHEPTPAHLARTRARLTKAGLTAGLASAREPWADKHVLLVDEVGYLAELYALGRFAFVGGSFKAKVHSVMEALGAGLVTFTGPFIQNNREAQEFARLAGEPGLTVVRSAAELEGALAASLAGDPRRAGARIRTEFERRTGAAARLADAILERLERN